MSEIANLLVSKNGKTIVWRQLKASNYEEIKKLAVEKIYKDEPAIAMLQPTLEEFSAFELPFLLELLNLDYSIGAFDVTNNDQLCGILMMTMHEPSSLKKVDYTSMVEGPSVSDSHFGSIQGRFLAKGYEEIDNHAKNKNYMLLEESAVFDEYCRMGIMTGLNKIIEMLARQHKCSFIFSLTTSKYTEQIMLNLGYKILKQIKYEQYFDEALGKNPFCYFSDIHKQATLFCIEVK